jgi:uncharacterized protein YchJ
MSEKKIIKRKLVVDFTYGEMLNTYSATDLKALAKLWGLKGYSKFKKEELVEAVEAYILDHLEERFSIFNLDHFTVIAELMKGNNVFKQFTVAANELISLGLILEGAVEDELQIVMPRVISERFVEFYNKYHENFTYNTIIKDYMELVISLYGVVSEEFFVESFYEFNEQAIEKDVIKSSVVYSANRTKNTTYTDGMLHYYRLAEFDAVYKDIQTKNDMAYRVIDHALLHQFVQSGNSLWEDQLKRFDEVVKAHFPDKDAVDLLDELLVMSAYNHGISDYVQLFSKKHESSNMVALKEFADAAITVNTEVPHWELKGFSPMDLSQYNKQMPIVKGDKIGRNDLCPCGSGKKYKKCCMN